MRRVALCVAVWIAASALGHAQAALLMEEPYGFFGALNPTGHDAIYFARICAETPVKLRRCAPGEPGSVFTRYQGIAGYDWVAMPLIAYLYSVEDPRPVPARVDRKTVTRLRENTTRLICSAWARPARGRHVPARVEPASGRGLRAPHGRISVCHY